MVPFADLKLILEFDHWMEWIFRFDDLFDNGDLRRDYDAAKTVMGYLSSKLKEDTNVTLPIGVHVEVAMKIARLHEPIFKAIKAHSTPGMPITRPTFSSPRTSLIGAER